MTTKLKEKWLYLYEVAQQIGVMKLWEDFAESDRFACIWRDKSKTVFILIYRRVRAEMWNRLLCR